MCRIYAYRIDSLTPMHSFTTSKGKFLYTKTQSHIKSESSKHTFTRVRCLLPQNFPLLVQKTHIHSVSHIDKRPLARRISILAMARVFKSPSLLHFLYMPGCCAESKLCANAIPGKSTRCWNFYRRFTRNPHFILLRVIILSYGILSYPNANFSRVFPFL